MAEKGKSQSERYAEVDVHEGEERKDQLTMYCTTFTHAKAWIIVVKEPLDSKIHTFTLILCDTQRTSTTTTEEITTHFQQKLCCQPGFTNYRTKFLHPFSLVPPIAIVCVCVCVLLTCSQSRSLACSLVISHCASYCHCFGCCYSIWVYAFSKRRRTKPSLSWCK